MGLHVCLYTGGPVVVLFVCAGVDLGKGPRRPGPVAVHVPSTSLSGAASGCGPCCGPEGGWVSWHWVFRVCPVLRGMCTSVPVCAATTHPNPRCCCGGDAEAEPVPGPDLPSTSLSHTPNAPEPCFTGTSAARQPDKPHDPWQQSRAQVSFPASSRMNHPLGRRGEVAGPLLPPESFLLTSNTHHM